MQHFSFYFFVFFCFFFFFLFFFFFGGTGDHGSNSCESLFPTFLAAEIVAAVDNTGKPAALLQ